MAYDGLSYKMQKAGYAQRAGFRAIDRDGNEHEVLELYVMGSHYAIRLADLVTGISGRGFVQVEALTHEWKYYLGPACGLARKSVSGKGLNIELFDAHTLTISLTALRMVMNGTERYAGIAKIPEQPALPPWKNRRFPTGQQEISAFV